MSRSAIGLLAVATDLLAMAIFLLALCIAEYFVKQDARWHKHQNLDPSDFSVMVVDMPPMAEGVTLEDIKLELWNHVSEKVRRQRQQLLPLLTSPHSTTILDIQLALRGDSARMRDAPKINRMLK